MSDLSRLLEDVYGDGGSGDTAPPAPPEWSSDEALDDTFASWVPGPPADAPAAERAFLLEDAPVEQVSAIEDVFAAFAQDAEEPTSEIAAVVADDQPAATSAPVTELWSGGALGALDDLGKLDDLIGVAAPPERAAVLPPPAPLPQAPTYLRWTPSDDDILPARAHGAKRRVTPSPALRLRRSSETTVAPSIPAAAVVTPAAAHEDEQEAPSRRARKPAPKHAKPKGGLQLQLRRQPKPSPADDAVAPPAGEPGKRRSFRLR